MFVVTNRLPVTSGREAEFEERFRKRARLIDGCPGFIRNEIHRPKAMKRNADSGAWEPDPSNLGYYEVKTWWDGFEHFVAWTKSEAFREAHKHKTPPDILRDKNEITFHEVFLSSDDPR